MTQTPERKSLFIAFEGGEGAGKTTQAGLLKERLQISGRQAHLTREPGGTELGEDLRRIILRPSTEHEAKREPHLTAAAELFLFLAARAQLVDEVIRPALAKNVVVVCDRFTASTIAYQGYGRRLDLIAVRKACDLTTNGLSPDLSILLDLPVDAGLTRKAEMSERDAIGQEGRDFHERVRRGFHALVAEEPERWLIVDATLPIETVSETIWRRVDGLLSGSRG